MNTKHLAKPQTEQGDNTGKWDLFLLSSWRRTPVYIWFDGVHLTIWGKGKDRREVTKFCDFCLLPAKTQCAGPRSSWFWIFLLPGVIQRRNLSFERRLCLLYTEPYHLLCLSQILLKNHYSVFWSIAKFLFVDAFSHALNSGMELRH